MSKLPVFKVVGEAYAFVWRKRDRFWQLAVPAIIISAISTALLMSAYSFSGILPGSEFDVSEAFRIGVPTGGPSWLYAVWSLYFMVHAAIIIMYSIAWHRNFLMPDELAPLRVAYTWRRRHTKYVIVNIPIFTVLILTTMMSPILFLTAMMIALPLISVVIDIKFTDAFSNVFMALIFTAPFWLYARLIMILPATAVEHHMTFSKVWIFTRNHGWRLFWIFLLSVIPLATLSWLVDPNFVRWLGQYFEFNSLVRSLLLGLVSRFFTCIQLAIGVTALSVSYKMLLENTDQVVSKQSE